MTDGKPDTGPFSVTPTFAYMPPSAFSTTPRLVVGGAVNGINMLVNGTNDFFLSFDANPAAAGYAMMNFTTMADRVGFVATDARVVEVPVTTAVPEPSVWTMMILGFAAIGLVLRRRSLFCRSAIHA
ncbi:PEPxxWA-CTERM sorting domain-containing protein [Sphingomonas mollis]|uniref:PEP-CTERM sorting domain-containing protein n=1 Tax=Sphingomonas mollis TaxID=2795726 RepID=A0ABS0XR11_9SPHN|nr:PEPxxWA-CTERM sorting domain-containing protein [Sphingomonas sp. BT553]MBJ6122178.1 PEP-CTERM sorting domain-containing protein [Sphingomonas sp. BT553]